MEFVPAGLVGLLPVSSSEQQYLIESVCLLNIPLHTKCVCGGGIFVIT